MTVEGQKNDMLTFSFLSAIIRHCIVRLPFSFKQIDLKCIHRDQISESAVRRGPEAKVLTCCRCEKRSFLSLVVVRLLMVVKSGNEPRPELGKQLKQTSQ